ncbi:hypothetical protein BLNAU_9428 [Blattamonas nauphoetae]|uniref:Uncharacterized protein n=1 Tax=Blattamonas nauphoetae TaxID=2049346 RepID=A0ABQ9XVS1_9EUKA|nr:hypothetical protein BLNAU_9428 [Blattamonas nauphoetae]
MHSYEYYYGGGINSLPNEFLATPLGQSLYPMIDKMMGRMNPVQDGNSNQVQFGNPTAQPFEPSSGQTLGSSLNLIPPQLSTKLQTPEEAVSQLRLILITSVDMNRILSKLYDSPPIRPDLFIR